MQKGRDRKSILQGQVFKIFNFPTALTFNAQKKKKPKNLGIDLKQAIICLKWHQKDGFIFSIAALSFCLQYPHMRNNIYCGSAAAPALAPRQDPQDNSLPTSLPLCQANVFYREKTKKGHLMKDGAGERRGRRERGVVKQWVQKCSGCTEGSAGLCTPFFLAAHDSVWSLEGQKEPA